MTDSESTQKTAKFANCDETFRIDNAKIIKRGQVTIEKKHRNNHNLDVGDYVDLKVYFNQTDIRVPDARIGESGRVTIPARQRKRYDLYVGDQVDLGVCVD